MNSPNSGIEILKTLEKCELAAITFVRDYVQFSFDGPHLSVYSRPRIKTPDYMFNLATPGYRDALCGQIGKLVIKFFEEPKEKLLIQFENQVIIEISLKEEDRNGPEAAMLQVDSGKRWNVW